MRSGSQRTESLPRVADFPSTGKRLDLAIVPGVHSNFGQRATRSPRKSSVTGYDVSMGSERNTLHRSVLPPGYLRAPRY